MASDGYSNIHLLDPEGGDSSHRSNEMHKHWMQMRRLSKQLTAATLEAMMEAEARSPGKPVLEVPLRSCPKCESENTYCSKHIFEDSSPLNSRLSRQRHGRSKSVALSNLDRVPGCSCSMSNFYFPMKDEAWLPLGVRNPAVRHTSNSRQQRSNHTIDCDDGYYMTNKPWLNSFCKDPLVQITTGGFIGRRSSSVNNLPITASQHTQTIFSSIASNEISHMKPRSRLTSSSLYSKCHDLRMQLSSLNKSRSFRKPGLDVGLRKTLSVTNAVVRMPIESATGPSKDGLRTNIGTDDRCHLEHVSCFSSQNKPKLPNSKQSNDSELGSLLSWPMGSTSPIRQLSDKVDDETIIGAASRVVTHPKSLPDALPNCERRLSRSEGSLFKSKSSEAKRDIQLQTSEDFEKEFKTSFNLPRILRAEDQTKVPEESADSDDLTKQRASEKWKDQFMTFFQPSDNKLAKKLFGTKMALHKERSRQRKQGKFIIHPCSNFR